MLRVVWEVLIRFDNHMGGVYHRFQGQKCSRSAHLELIWEIPVDRSCLSLNRLWEAEIVLSQEAPPL